MSYLDFFSSIISSLAWPGAIVLLAWLMKDELRGLVNSLRITRFKLKDFEAEFAESMNSIEKEISDPAVRDKVADEPVPQEYKKLLDVDPNYAVLDAWKDLEARVVELSVRKFDNPKTWPVRRHILDLVKRDVLPPEVGSALEELNHARNQIVHARDYKLEKNAATRYIDLAADMVGFLMRIM